MAEGWSSAQRRNFKKTIRARNAKKGREVIEVPVRPGFAVVEGTERVMDVTVSSGSQITLSVGGYTVRVRAVKEGE